MEALLPGGKNPSQNKQKEITLTLFFLTQLSRRKSRSSGERTEVNLYLSRVESKYPRVSELIGKLSYALLEQLTLAMSLQ